MFQLDRFAWIGAFSTAPLLKDFDATFPDLESQANSQLRLLWIACGTEDAHLDRLGRVTQHAVGGPQTAFWSETYVELPRYSMGPRSREMSLDRDLVGSRFEMAC